MGTRPSPAQYSWLNPGLEGQREIGLAYGKAWQPTDVYPALAHLRAASLNEVWDAQAWVDLARGHLLAGELDQGRQALEQAALLGALDPGVLYQLAALSREAGEFDQARNYLRRARRAQPDNPLVLVELAKVYFADPKLLGLAGFGFLYDARQLDPTCGEAWRLRGHACIHWAFWKVGHESFRRLLELEPGNVEALWNMAAIAQRAGWPQAACRALLALGTVDREKALELQLILRPSIEQVAAARRDPGSSSPRDGEPEDEGEHDDS